MSKPTSVAIVGPVAPFRSGVAKHTSELALELVTRAEVSLKVYSFSRQYPRSLFPGDDDRDANTGAPEGLDVSYCLDSVNPTTWFTVANAVIKSGAEIVILPAWTFFLAPCLGVVAWICRRKGIEVVQIVHNAVDHESAFWKRQLSKFQLQQASRFITHGSQLKSDIEELGCGGTVSVHPHPLFNQYPEPEGALPKRENLEILFFGLIRHYKGLDMALKALSQSQNTDIILSVVGEFWEGEQDTLSLIKELGLSDQVEVTSRYVSDAEAAEFFHRADVVLLPYKHVTGSGVIPVAYRYDTPVIVTDHVGLTEVVEDGVTGFIVPDEVSLVDLLKRSDRNTFSGMVPAIEKYKQRFSWQSYADCLLTLGRTDNL